MCPWPVEGPFYVYEVRNDRGRAVYVGLSKNPYKRMLAHRRTFYTRVCRWLDAADAAGREWGLVIVARHEDYSDGFDDEYRRTLAAASRGLILNTTYKGSKRQGLIHRKGHSRKLWPLKSS